MPYKIAYYADEHYIETKVTGIVTFEDILSMVLDIGQTATTVQCLACLTDYREATLQLDTLALYELCNRVSTIFTNLGLFTNQIRRANVVKLSTLENFYFYETVCLNRGHQIKVFTEMNNAKEWLLKKRIAVKYST